MSEVQRFSPHDVHEASLREATSRLRSWNEVIPREKGLLPPYSSQALKYFIPLPVYEAAKDPQNVRVVVSREHQFGSEFLVAEDRGVDLTDPEAMSAYKESINKRDHLKLPLVDLRLPEGIDPMHWELLGEMPDGMSLRDYIFFTADLVHRKRNGALHVVSYDTRKELEGRGIATGFYGQLREFAKMRGYRFITGNNSEDNIAFFTSKLGRARLVDLPTDIREAILTKEEEADSDYDVASYTVDLLHDSDRQRVFSKQP